MNTLEHILDMNGETEELKGTNKAFCTYCDKKRDSMKNLRWTVGPKILVMQLMRYKKKIEGNRKTAALPTHSEKLEQWVAFQKEIKVKNIAKTTET